MKNRGVSVPDLQVELRSLPVIVHMNGLPYASASAVRVPKTVTSPGNPRLEPARGTRGVPTARGTRSRRLVRFGRRPGGDVAHAERLEGRTRHVFGALWNRWRRHPDTPWTGSDLCGKELWEATQAL